MDYDLSSIITMKKKYSGRSEIDNMSASAPMGTVMFWLTIGEVVIVGLGLLGWLLDWF